MEIAWDDVLQDDFQKGIFDMELEDLEGHVDDIEQDCNEVFFMFYDFNHLIFGFLVIDSSFLQ